jgi:hypothetical protein
MRKSELRQIIREEIKRTQRLNEMYHPGHWKNFVSNGYFVFEKMPDELMHRIMYADYGSHSSAFSLKEIYAYIKKEVRKRKAKDLMKYVKEMESMSGDSFASDNYGL